MSSRSRRQTEKQDFAGAGLGGGLAMVFDLLCALVVVGGLVGLWLAAGAQKGAEAETGRAFAFAAYAQYWLSIAAAITLVAVLLLGALYASRVQGTHAVNWVRERRVLRFWFFAGLAGAFLAGVAADLGAFLLLAIDFPESAAEIVAHPVAIALPFAAMLIFMFASSVVTPEHLRDARPVPRLFSVKGDWR